MSDDNIFYEKTKFFHMSLKEITDKEDSQRSLLFNRLYRGPAHVNYNITYKITNNIMVIFLCPTLVTIRKKNVFLYFFTELKNLPSLLFLSTDITLSTVLILAERVSYELCNGPRSPWSLWLSR